MAKRTASAADARRQRQAEQREKRLKRLAQELQDVARGVEGSRGYITLSPTHSEIFLELAGLESIDDDDPAEDELALEELGGGALKVPAHRLCELVLEDYDPMANQVDTSTVAARDEAADRRAASRKKKPKVVVETVTGDDDDPESDVGSDTTEE